VARLIYTTIASLDGYVADVDGNFGWAEPDEEVHRFVNDLERPVGTYLFGRRMYEVMVYWETADMAAGLPPVGREFAAIWRAASKIVYSRTLGQASSARTTIEREFDPAAVRRLKAEARQDITVRSTPCRSGAQSRPRGRISPADHAGHRRGRYRRPAH
jgi:dihydrofolate reductase